MIGCGHLQYIWFGCASCWCRTFGRSDHQLGRNSEAGGEAADAVHEAWGTKDGLADDPRHRLVDLAQHPRAIVPRRKDLRLRLGIEAKYHEDVTEVEPRCAERHTHVTFWNERLKRKPLSYHMQPVNRATRVQAEANGLGAGGGHLHQPR